jgi:hypothetical protein
MKLGIYLNPQRRSRPAARRDVGASAARALGFDSIWAGEHGSRSRPKGSSAAFEARPLRGLAPRIKAGAGSQVDESEEAMTRDRILFLILGAMAVAVVVLGYQLYQDRKKTTGIDINIGERGISIEKK